jgi:hypothetical protein
MQTGNRLANRRNNEPDKYGCRYNDCRRQAYRRNMR